MPPREPQAKSDPRGQFYDDIATGRLNIGQAVRRMRQLSGLTQEKFAKHRGVSLLTLKRIESGRGNPTVETLERIASIFALRVAFVHNNPMSDARRRELDRAELLGTKRPEA